MSPLQFTGTKEHALVALVIQLAHQSPNVPYLGRTALQKITYFLKALGVPMRYSFEIHHYGPYSDQLASDLELLAADGVIEDKAKNTSTKYWNYVPTATGRIDALVGEHEQTIGRYRELVKGVVNGLGRLEPRDLELYSTLHYAYRYETASRPKPSKDAVVKRFKDYKGNKFTEEEINVGYDAMLNAKLIEVSTEQ